jgi:hypothetical protein
MSFPNTVDDLIAARDKRYPEVTAKPGDDPDTIFHRSIQRAVIQDIKIWRASAGKQPPLSRQRGRGRDVSS